MTRSHVYSEQELAVMSWEELIAHLRRVQDARPEHLAPVPRSRSAAPPAQPEALRLVGGL